MEERQAIFWQEKTENLKFSVLNVDKLLFYIKRLDEFQKSDFYFLAI